MHFDLTDDQKMLRDQLGSLLADRLPDKTLMRLYDAPDSFDPALWSALMQMGLGGVLAPESSGGLAAGLLTLATVAESLADFAAPAPVVANALAAWLLSQSERHQHRVASLIAGDTIAAFALAARTGWTPQNWTLDGERLNGSIGGAEWGARANLFIIGLSGGRLGLVDRDAPGLSIECIDTVDRTRPLSTIDFDETVVDTIDVEPSVVDRLLDALAVLHAADACGAANKTLSMSLDYANLRHQFGRPISQFQGLKYQLVEMATDVHPCRPLVWYAAHAWDAIPRQSPRAASIAKAHVTEIAVKTGRAAVEAHGGIGYTWEYPLHVWLKRAMHDRAVYGAPAVHRARAAALAGW